MVLDGDPGLAATAAFSGDYLIDHIFSLSPEYGEALLLTIVMAVVSMVLGLVLGGVVSAGQRSRLMALRVMASIYSWLFRGIPELVLLVLLFTGMAYAGIFRFEDLDLLGIEVAGSVQAAIVAFAVREGAYSGEIFRASLASVDPGQVEGAKALGMTRAQVMRRVVAPQALRVAVPPLGNDFNIMLKLTSLASVIGVPELVLTTQNAAAANFRVFELFIGLAINYLLLTTAWSVIQSFIEMRLNVHETDPDARGLWRQIRGHLVGGGGLAREGRTT